MACKNSTNNIAILTKEGGFLRKFNCEKNVRIVRLKVAIMQFLFCGGGKIKQN